VIELSDTASPVPERLITCGVFVPLSLIVSVPVLAPTTVGENVMLIEHFVPAATDVPHVFVSPQSPATTILVIETLTDSLFVKLAVLAVLVVPVDCPSNAMVTGNAATAAIPVPVKPTVCGLPLALSVIVNVPFSAAAIVGLNVTLIVHFAPAATDAPHVLVCE
jgi:hypothetical protein